MCRFRNIYYYKGRWVVHSDKLNVAFLKATQVPGLDPLKHDANYAWVAHNYHINTSASIFLVPRKNFVVLQSNEGLVQLSPRGGLHNLWTPAVGDNNLSFLRRCKRGKSDGNKCLGISDVSHPIFLLHRIEPETFGHVLVDSIYSSIWTVHDLVGTIEANKTDIHLGVGDFLDRMQFVLADPFELTRNDELFQIISAKEVLKNGDDLCEEGKVCRIEHLFVGLGCRGTFFSSKRHRERAAVANVSRKRMLENVAQSREIDSMCRVKITIVLRYPSEGRAFDSRSVDTLVQLIYDNFAVPVQTVYMQELSLQQQFRLLHDTSILIAMDGSVLDMVPVMRESSAVITLVPERREYLHWRLFQSLSSSNAGSCTRDRKQQKQFYTILAPSCTGVHEPDVCFIPVDAVLLALKTAIQNQQNEFSQEKCKHWWYFNSNILEANSASIKRANWQHEFDYFNVGTSGMPGMNQPKISANCQKWYPTILDRNGVLKMLKKHFNYRKVLEIGCTKNSKDRFSIGASESHVDTFVCVDPLSGKGEYKVTSDTFFETVKVKSMNFDLVFIDGLHTSTQAMRDITNALLHLSANGVIAVHDSNPRHRIESESIYYGTLSWNGDVWRAIAYLIENYGNLLDIATLPFDWGITLVRFKSSKKRAGNLSERELAFEISAALSSQEHIQGYTSLPFSILSQRREEILHLISLCELETYFA